MTQLELIKVILMIAFLILSLGIHEAAHAWVAHLRGDDTAKALGRLTLNPIAHIDPFMTVILPAILYFTTGFMFGGAKPVPVNPHRLRHPLRDMMLVALAGPASNVLLAIVFMVAYKTLALTGMDNSSLAMQVMGTSMYFNLLLAAFNMIPIPPLDGSRVMAYLLPSGMRETYVGLERFGMLIVFGLIAFGGLGTILWPMMRWMEGVVDVLTGGQWL